MSAVRVDTPTPSPLSPDRWRARRSLWAVVGIVVVALNLRTPIAALSTLLGPLSADLALPSWSLSVLSTLPTLCLGLVAFVGPALRRAVGDERLILGCVVVIVLGDLLRTLHSGVAMFLGTTVIAAGIGVANVAIPGLIKRDFPERFSGVTGLYAAVMTFGAAVGSAGAETLAAASGADWAGPLAVLTVPVALVALVVWLPAVVMPPESGGGQAGAAPAVYRDPVAWTVTAFFGATTLLAYFVLGWLPTVVTDQGVVRDGGLVLAVSSLVQVAGAALGPVLARRIPDLRVIAVGAAVLTALGLAGVTLAPSAGIVWGAAAVLGFAQGVGFNLALTLIGLRSPDATIATALSGMTQGVGYLIGVAGPLGAGLLHTATGGWTVPLVALLVVGVAQALGGIAAGRERPVAASTIPTTQEQR
jgi:MFS transporter, CP family, cyanate transporter